MDKEIYKYTLCPKCNNRSLYVRKITGEFNYLSKDCSMCGFEFDSEECK